MSVSECMLCVVEQCCPKHCCVVSGVIVIPVTEKINRFSIKQDTVHKMFLRNKGS